MDKPHGSEKWRDEDHNFWSERIPTEIWPDDLINDVLRCLNEARAKAKKNADEINKEELHEILAVWLGRLGSVYFANKNYFPKDIAEDLGSISKHANSILKGGQAISLYFDINRRGSERRDYIAEAISSEIFKRIGNSNYSLEYVGEVLRGLEEFRDVVMAAEIATRNLRGQNNPRAWNQKKERTRALAMLAWFWYELTGQRNLTTDFDLVSNRLMRIAFGMRDDGEDFPSYPKIKKDAGKLAKKFQPINESEFRNWYLKKDKTA